ncbi:MAG: hypothetical protein DRI90_10280 [Deltaproteobacteria bacterium]|nr:MAG: hypothetical protein DRI90_10280 [Deltaproteobacteria bacterium]
MAAWLRTMGATQPQAARGRQAQPQAVQGTVALPIAVRAAPLGWQAQVAGRAVQLVTGRAPSCTR